MADERFAPHIEEADADEPGIVLVVHDDLSIDAVTPDGKTVPLDGLTGSGGGGGGGASTIADGADVAEGATTDAVVAAGAAGTVSAKLRRLTTDTDAIKTSVAAIDAGTPVALGAGGGMKVDGSGTALPVSDGAGSLTVDSTQLPAALAAGGGIKVEGVAGGVAQPVSAASLPLPSGAATSALQGGGMPAALGAGGGLKIDGSGTALPVSGTVTATPSGTQASSVADGSDVAQGATSDAAVTTNTTGTVSGKLRGIVSLLAAALKVGGSVASDAPVTDNPLLGGGRASTATPSAVSADGDAVAAWHTRTGAAVVDGGVAEDAAAAGSPVPVGGIYRSTPPTYANLDRGQLQQDAAGDLKIVQCLLDGTFLTTTTPSQGRSAFTSPVSFGYPHLWNGGSWDTEAANVPVTLLSSAARTAATSSADQTNYNQRGIIVVINVTAEAGTTTLTLTIQGKDSISSNYFDLITGIIVYNAATDAPTVTRAVLIYPGVLTADAIGAGNANLISAKALVIPRVWRATVTPSDASSQTYSLSSVTIV